MYRLMKILMNVLENKKIMSIILLFSFNTVIDI